MIDEIIKETGLDFEEWQTHYNDPKTMEAVEDDLLLVEQYGITSVPTLIIYGQHRISGALQLRRILSLIERAIE